MKLFLILIMCGIAVNGCSTFPSLKSKNFEFRSTPLPPRDVVDKIDMFRSEIKSPIPKKIKYDLDAKGQQIMVDAHELTRAKQMEYDKQNAYVEYLKNAVNQIGFYSNGVDKILKRAEIKGKYGE